MQRKMRVKFWGVRGSLPCPGTDHAVYGGNTSCVEVQCGAQTIIFDAGSGLRPCGDLLSKSALKSANIFLSHYHHDHIMGFPFFKPAYDSDFSLKVHGPKPQGMGSVNDALESYLSDPFFPVGIDQVMPHVQFKTLDPSEITTLGDVAVSSISLNHPGGALGYRAQLGPLSVCYITDLEHSPGELNGRLLSFIRGTDLLIYDSTYTDDEFPTYCGWGHSTWQEAVRLGNAGDVRHVAIFHHDPHHDDRFMDNVEKQAKALCSRCIVTRDGMELTLLGM